MMKLDFIIRIDVILVQYLLHAHFGKFFDVIIEAQVTQIYAFRPIRDHVFHRMGGIFIRNVPDIREYALFRHPRISAHPEHIHIMIGFQYYEIGLSHFLLYNLRGMTNIGDKKENLLVCLNPIPNAITAIVRNAEGCYSQVAYLCGL